MKATAKRKCIRCGIEHFSVTLDEGECLVCRYFELCRDEQLSMVDAIAFLRDKGICAYCGEYADEVEHVVPRCTGLPTYTLLACRECNHIASGTLFGSFSDKANYIKGQLRARYSKVLRTPEWTEDEYEDISYKMRKKIQAIMLAKDVVARRVEWTWLRAYWSGSERTAA